MIRKISFPALVLIALILLGFFVYCRFTPDEQNHIPFSSLTPKKDTPPIAETPRKDVYKSVHVFVCLCDNKNQGIVPVPEKIGNGQDPANNLYWGAMYGVKTFFRKSGRWEEIPVTPAWKNAVVLERVAFKLKNSSPPVFVFAEAYDGSCMKEALTDFLTCVSGGHLDTFKSGENEIIEAGGDADAVCFVGHNGLMDLTLEKIEAGEPGRSPVFAAVLACKSRKYFLELLKNTGVKSTITTTNFMAPEAYTLEAIILSWSSGESLEEIRKAAGEAYAKYQRISPSAGINLFAADILK